MHGVAPAGAGADTDQAATGATDRPSRHTRPPRICVGLTYYSPYVSGLTEAARRLSEELARRGWEVHVVCTVHDPMLARHSVINGVGVRRSRVLLALGKASLSPSFSVAVIRSAREADLVFLHLPLPEAGLIARFVDGRRLALMYQCDPASLRVPGQGLLLRVLDGSHRYAMNRARIVFTSSEDYARSSRLRGEILPKQDTLHPPCIERPLGEPSYRETPGLHVGFLGRVVEEKGLEYLVAAFREIDDPDARLLIAGDFEEVAGGSVIRSVSKAAGGDPRIRLLGYLPEDRVADFYASIDVFALPSVNSFEAFGIVQVEALMAGVPVVASDLPGVRTVASVLGAGSIVPPRDVGALRDGLLAASGTAPDREAIRRTAIDTYGIRAVADHMERRFEEVLEDVGPNQRARVRRRLRRRGSAARLAVSEPDAEALRRVSRRWWELAADDPMWAVLTDRRRGTWTADEFLATGDREVDELVASLEAWGLEPPTGTALDFGCGAGRVTQALARRVGAAIGIDASGAMLDAARELDRTDGRCEFLLNDSVDLAQVATGSIDLVYCSRVLQHLPLTLVAGYVAEFFRVVRPGGLVVLQMPSRPASTVKGVAVRLVPRSLADRARRGMEMHGCDQAVMRSWIASAGGLLLVEDRDDAAGSGWESWRYVARAGTRP